MHPPNDKELEELKLLLNEEIDSYTKVEAKLAQKKLVLVQGDMKELTRLDQELTVLAQKTTELEKRRLALLIQMGRRHETLQEFMSCLDLEDTRPFEDARFRLKRVMENVTQLNHQNQSLLEVSLKWIQNSVETLARLITPEGAAYSATGEKASVVKEHSNISQSTVEHSV